MKDRSICDSFLLFSYFLTSAADSFHIECDVYDSHWPRNIEKIPTVCIGAFLHPSKGLNGYKKQGKRTRHTIPSTLPNQSRRKLGVLKPTIRKSLSRLKLTAYSKKGNSPQILLNRISKIIF